MQIPNCTGRISASMPLCYVTETERRNWKTNVCILTVCVSLKAFIFIPFFLDSAGLRVIDFFYIFNNRRLYFKHVAD